MTKAKSWIFLICIASLLLSGCKDTSEKDISAKNNVSEKQSAADAYVTIHLEDGRTIELDPRRQSGIINSKRLNVNLSDYGIIVMLRLHDNNEAVEEKDYTDPRADIAIKNVAKDGALDEEYRSYYYEDQDGNEGKTQINITSFGENHAEGTFTGTLYSKSQKKATVEGKFSIKTKKK